MAYDKAAKAAADKARYLRRTEEQKEADRQRARDYRAAHPDEMRAYDRERRTRPDERAARAAYNTAYREANRGRLNAYKREWIKANYPRIKDRLKEQSGVTPAMHAANMRVFKAIRRGEIVRPEACSECGQPGFIEAAHENYEERLAIRWLCRSCHRRWDRGQPKRSAS